MKKTGIFKIVLIILLAFGLLTWIFSASYYNSGALEDMDMYNIGFFDFWQLLFGSFEFSYFIQILLLLVSVGALYGVLGKTGKYRAWIERIVKRFKGSELVFLLAVAFIIATITSVFDYGFALFIFFPLLISIILAMGYDKITAFLATFGATLVGTIGSTTGYNISGVINEILNVESNNAIVLKIILFLVSLIVLFFFLYKAKRSKDINEEDDMFIGEKKSNKYSICHIIIVLSLLLIILILGCTAWEKTFEIDVFTELNTAITEFTVKLPRFHITTSGIVKNSEEVAIFAKILGTVSAFGEWYYAEMAVMCILASLILGWIYRIGNVFDAMYEGAKKMLRPALLVMFVYTVIYFAGNTMIYNTIANVLLNATKTFNLFTTTISMVIASAFHVDMLYVANYAIPQIAALDVSSQAVGILSQGIYGVTMFICPTSAMLALGLSYLGISYKDWVKKSWKLTLSLFVVVMIFTIIALY